MAENTLGRNQVFAIKNADGTPFHDLVLHKATYDSVVMSLGDKITGDVYYKDNGLNVTMLEYIEYDGVKYILVAPPTIVRNGIVSDNSELKGMTKYSFTFYHPMYQLSNLPFSDVAVTEDSKRYLSENKVFSWIGYPNDFIAKIDKNLEGTQWMCVRSASFPTEKDTMLSEVLSFSNNTIADALKTWYDTWDIPYVIEQVKSGESGYSSGKRFKVIMGLPSGEIYEYQDGHATQNKFVFRMGQGLGLKNNSLTPRNNKIVTRISGCGSEDNIPYGYPQIIWYGEQGRKFTYGNSVGTYTNVTIGGHTFPKIVSYPIYKGIVGGMYVELIQHPFTRTNLMPSVYRNTLFNKISFLNPNGTPNTNYNPDITLVDSYDAIPTSQYPYVNAINPDAPSYEYHEFEEVKPELGEESITGVTPINNDLTPASSWDDTMNDDGEYVQSYFKITLPVLSFDIYACAAITQEMQINMRSGACIGCTFPVQVDWEAYKASFYDEEGEFSPSGSQRDYEKFPDSSQESISLILQKEFATFGTLMPNVYQNPHVGDLFVVLGISLPESYITNAEERLVTEMKSYMLLNNVHYYDYPLKFDEYFLANNTDILRQIRPNSIVRFKFNNETLQLYVKQLAIKFEEATLPQYDITLTDNIDVVTNPIGKVSDNVDKLATIIALTKQGLKYGGEGKGGDGLSRTHDDTAAGVITFLKGINIGRDFISGILGEGGVFRKEADGKTYLETDSLYVRMKAYFDTVEIKKYEHSSGNRTASNAGFKTVRVVPFGYYQGEFVPLGEDHKYHWTTTEIDTETGQEVTVEHKSGVLEIQFYRCYYRATDGEDTVTNDFRVGDLAFVRETNTDTLNQHHLWRVVVGKDNGSNITENGEGWIDLSNRNSEQFTITTIEDGQSVNHNFLVKGYEYGSDAPMAQDDIVQLGNVNNAERQGAIVEYVNGANSPSYQIYQKIGEVDYLDGQTIHNPYVLADKNMIAIGYNSATGKAYMNVYGDAFIGAKDNSTYVKYDSAQKKVTIKAALDINSTVDGKTIGSYFESLDDVHRVFSSELGNLDANSYPKPPYSKGDIWVNAVYPSSDMTVDGQVIPRGSIHNNEILVCKTNNDEKTRTVVIDEEETLDYELFSIADWKRASEYQHTFDYLTNALKAMQEGSTQITGGLVLSSMIALRDTQQTPNIWSGISGIYTTGGIAAWYGGNAIDYEALETPKPAWSQQRYAKSLFRFDGSGYLAGGNITWDSQGRVAIKDITTLIGGNNTDVLNALTTFNSAFHFNTQQGTGTIISIVPQMPFASLQILENGTANNVATQKWVDNNYVSIGFFNKLFQAYKSSTITDANKVIPNDVQTTIDNLKIMVGAWTEQYLSALGLNSANTQGVILNEPLETINNSGLSLTGADGKTLVYDSNLGKFKWGTAGASLNAALTAINSQALAAPTTANTAIVWDGSKFVWGNTGTTLSIASENTLGGIKVGTTLEINSTSGVLNQKSGVATPGTYFKATVDTYGRVTGGSTSLTENDIPSLSISKITGLETQLGNFVTLTGAQTISGVKTFTPQQTFTNGIKIGNIELIEEGGGLHVKGGLYTDTFLSALGLNGDNSGSAFDEEDMWVALGTTSSSKKIAATYLSNVTKTLTITYNGQTYNYNGTGAVSIPITGGGTTYTFAEGTVNGAFSVTPSGGTAQSVAIHGLKALAYKDSLTESDIPNITKSKISDFPTKWDWSNIDNKPTTLSGYGITDAVSSNTTWWGRSISNGKVEGAIENATTISASTSITVGDSFLNGSQLRIGAANASYHILIGSRSDYIWFDCRNSSNAMVNAFQLYPNYTNFEKDVVVSDKKIYLHKTSNGNGDVYLEYVSSNGGVHLVGGGLYADHYLSALGLNSDSSASTFDEQAMWEALSGTTNSTQIASSHLSTALTDYVNAISKSGNGTNTVITDVSKNGHTLTFTYSTFSSSDTKNTAGATDTSSKIFLIGATAQNANPQTYSHDTAYVGTDGCLYSNSKKVAINDDVTALQGYFTSGIANTASKLSTVSKTAWGRTYWTANGVPDSISGDISNAADIYIDNGKCIYFKNNATSAAYKNALQLTSENKLQVGYGTSNMGYDTCIYGNNIYFGYGISRTTGITLDSSGNVGIGGTNSSYKFYTNGNSYLNGTLYVNGVPSEGTPKLYVSGTSYFTGNIGVKTTPSSRELDVNGSIAAKRLYLKNDANDVVYIEYDTTNKGIHIVNAGLYSDTFMSALGLNADQTSGGGGEGTVTSVGLTAVSGSHLYISGVSPITSSGTLGVGVSSGYSIPSTSSQSNWDTAYAWGNHANAGYIKTRNINDGNNSSSTFANVLDSQSGTFAFYGDNLIDAHYDWVGLQVDYNGYDKGQLVWSDGTLWIRQKDSTTWTDWATVLTDKNYSSYISISGNFVTLDTAQNISGVKTFLAAIAPNDGITPIDSGVVTTASAGNKLWIKKAYSSTDGTPNNGLVLEYGGSATWTGQLYMGDNGTQGLYWGGWYNGTRQEWKKFAFTSDLSSYLPLSGGTMTGGLTLKADQYSSNNVFGLNVNNSDIIGLNGMYFADTAGGGSEGINFVRSDGDWNYTYDALYAIDGTLYFQVNNDYVTNTMGTAYKVLHSGNLGTQWKAVNDTNSSNGYIRIATIVFTGTSRQYAGFTLLFSTTETADHNSYIMQLLVRRNTTSSTEYDFELTPLGSTAPLGAYVVNNGYSYDSTAGAYNQKFFVYIKKSPNAWLPYYAMTPLYQRGNVTFESVGVSSISATVTATINSGGGGNYIPLTGSSSLSGTFAPTTNNSGAIGSSSKRFGEGYFVDLDVESIVINEGNYDDGTDITIQWVKNLTSSGDGTLGDLSATNGKKTIPNMNLLRYWNGRYSSSASNLKYCVDGEILSKAGGTCTGDIIVKKSNASVKVQNTDGTKIVGLNCDNNRGVYDWGDGSNKKWLIGTNSSGSGVSTAFSTFVVNVAPGSISSTHTAYNFYVSGTGYFTGALKASSYSNTSDMRMKDVEGNVALDIEDIAASPIISFHWKDRSIDNALHLGTSAQYWQSKLPQVVSVGSDGMLSQDYATTALAGVISVARKVVTHEDEIKSLKKRISELEQKVELLKAA